MTAKDKAIKRISLLLGDRISNAIFWSRQDVFVDKARRESYTTPEAIEALLREELREFPNNPA